MSDGSAENCQKAASSIINTTQLTEFEFVVIFFGECLPFSFQQP